MDIQHLEPLKTIIDLTTDKKLTILFFLNDNLQCKLKEYELIDDTFYLNDFVCIVKKNNLENIYNGKIISVIDNEITIKNNQHNITIDTDLYYVFVKRNLSKNNDRQFYKSLLEKL